MVHKRTTIDQSLPKKTSKSIPLRLICKIVLTKEVGDQYKLSAHVAYHHSNSLSSLCITNDKWTFSVLQNYTDLTKSRNQILLYATLYCEEQSYTVRQFSICTVPFYKAGQHKNINCSTFSKSFFSSLVPVTEGKAEASLNYPRNQVNGYIQCLQDASPSVGDVGVVGEARSGFRDILSNSA